MKHETSERIVKNYIQLLYRRPLKIEPAMTSIKLPQKEENNVHFTPGVHALKFLARKLLLT